MSEHVIELNAENFNTILSSNKVVLVDFWASWCGPCRMIAPTIESLGAEYAGRAVVGKLNVDENGKEAASYRVMSIPTVLLFKDGKEVERFVGLQPKEVLSKALLEVF